jgi:hypothetical protein
MVEGLVTWWIEVLESLLLNCRLQKLLISAYIADRRRGSTAARRPAAIALRRSTLRPAGIGRLWLSLGWTLQDRLVSICLQRLYVAQIKVRCAATNISIAVIGGLLLIL